MGLGYYINKAIRGIKKNGALVSPDENGIVTISADASVVCDISDGVIGFRAKLFSVLDSTKSLQIAPIYFRQETNDHQELLLPMVKFSYTDDDNFSASFEITGTKTNIRLDVVVDGGDWLPLLSETVDEVVLFTEEERVKLLGISDNANDNVIEEIKVNNVPLVPDANKSVNIVMSGGESGESNVIETVKVNGTPLVPDANKAVDVITVNYITQDMTAAEILAVAARCANSDGKLKEPIYYKLYGIFFPCVIFSYNSINNFADIMFYDAKNYEKTRFYVSNGEVTKTYTSGYPTPANIGAAEAIHTHTGYAATGHNHDTKYARLNHDHAGVYQPVESGKGLSTNDLTAALKSNYDTAYTHSQAAHALSTAQENVIETVKVNGNALTVTNKAVDIVEPQWRTIKTLTLTEALNEIVITSDSDNAAFSLVGYIVKLEIPTAAVAGNAAVRASASAEMESAVLYSSFQQGVNSSGARYMACRGELRGGLWSVDTQYPTTYADSGANVQTSMVSIGSAVTGVTAVSRFRISSSASTAFPVGTVITVLGVDANA